MIPWPRKHFGPKDEPLPETMLDVVILNWHDEEMTQACVSSLDGEDHIRAIYVVDNESSNRLTARGISSLHSVIVLEVPENRGFAGGINVAFRARHEAGVTTPVLVLNNDATVQPGALAAMMRELEAHPRSIVGPTLINPDGSIQAAGHRISKVSGIARANLRPRRIDFVTWACVLLPSDSYRLIGELDEAFFMYWEDAEYGMRSARAGMTNRIASDAFVSHQLSASGNRAGTKLAEYYARGFRLFGQKERGMALLRAYAGISLLLLKRLASRDQAGLRAQARGWRDPLPSPAWKHINSDATKESANG